MTLLTIIWLQLLHIYIYTHTHIYVYVYICICIYIHIYIYSGYSSNMEMLRAMLAFLIHLEEARHGAEVWLEPSL